MVQQGHDYAAAFTAYEETQKLLNEYESTRDPSLLPKLEAMKADCERAIDAYLSGLHKVGDENPIALKALSMMYRMLGGIHMYLREYEEAEDCYHGVVDISSELGDLQEMVQAYNNLGVIAMSERRYSDAVDYFQQGMDNLNFKTRLMFGSTLKKNLKEAKKVAGR